MQNNIFEFDGILAQFLMQMIVRVILSPGETLGLQKAIISVVLFHAEMMQAR